MSQLHAVKQGRGPAIVLSHALGADLSMWDEVVGQLAPGFTVLRYDHRGHGRSGTVAGLVSIDELAADAAQVIQAHLDGPVHFVGLSMGGMVAQRLAALRPELVASVVIANSASGWDDVGRAMWRARVETVLNLGMEGIADAMMARWLTAGWRASPHHAARLAQIRSVFESTDPRSYAACADAVSRIDFAASNPLIACPSLVIAGAFDESTPTAAGQAIRNSISGAQLVTLPCAHLSAVESPVEFAAHVAAFIARI